MNTDLKDRVLEACDIVDVVGAHVRLARKGHEYMGLCPFHPDKNPSMTVSPKKQIFKCFACGAGGDVIKFVQLRERVDFREALAVLARRAGIDVRSGEVDRVGANQRDQLRRTMEWARAHFRRNLTESGEGRAALDYARSRGLSEDTLARFHLGFALESWDDVVRAGARAGVSPEILAQAGLTATNEKGRTYDRFRNRLIFPIADGQGRVVAFGGRTLGDDPAKYLNSPETPLFSKSRILYGLDAARPTIEEAGTVIVVEGYMDAVLLHQYGFDNAVATLGTALTDAHIKLVKPVTETVYLCFDGDTAGVKAADRAVEIALRNRISVKVVMMPGGNDPADCVVRSGSVTFAQCLQNAMDALEFKWRQVVSSFDGPGQKTQHIAAADFLQFIAGVSVSGGIDPLEEGMLVGRLSDVLALPAGVVYGQLARAKGAAKREAAAVTIEIGEQSEYSASVRGVPPGLITAIEALLGIAIRAPQHSEQIEMTIAPAVGFCDAWRRLRDICRTLREELQGFTQEEVLARCEDPALCELVGRACAATSSLSPGEIALATLQQRLDAELNLLQMDDLRGQLRGASATNGPGEDAYRSLLAAAQRQNGFLSADARVGLLGARPN